MPAPALALLAFGCADRPIPPSSAPWVVPVARAVLQPVDPLVPLVRVVSVDCTVPCDAVATWSDEARTRSAATSTRARSHALALVGMRPATDYTAALAVTDETGAAIEVDEVTWSTDPLPVLFPEVAVLASHPTRMEPGDTIVGISSAGVDLTVVLDPTGAVVWYRDELPGEPRITEARVEPDGVILGLSNYDQLHETDWTGRVLWRWWAGEAQGDGVAVEVPLFHHEVRRAAGGDLLTLTHHPVVVAGYPASYTDPAVVADAVVIVDHVVQVRDDGTVAHDHDLSTVLDVRRIGYRSLDLDDAGVGMDWSHANTATEHLDDDGLVVSLRHQDAVVELDRQTGALRWILANPDNWTPELDAVRLVPVGDPFAWPYHQHAVEVGEDGRLLMFDNGNVRSSPFDGIPQPPLEDNWSRVVEYRIDEAARTVEQLWAFEPPGQRLWSGAMGSAERQPTSGTVLSLWGYIGYVDGVARPDAGTSVRVIEFVPETGEVVLDLALDSDQEIVPGGWNAYRAHRIPAL